MWITKSTHLLLIDVLTLLQLYITGGRKGAAVLCELLPAGEREQPQGSRGGRGGSGGRGGGGGRGRGGGGGRDRGYPDYYRPNQ